VRVGALTIDTFQHTVTFGDTALHLTPTEYELVYCLARAQGRVLEYREIAQQTHGNVSDRNEAHGLLKTHIQNLRRKIDPDYIVSVRGVGYMLVAPTQRSTP
jgi:DNA-binding response OmpR family regulator